MTNAQIAARLRDIAGRKPTDVFRELHALAMDLEQGLEPLRTKPPVAVTQEDLEALVRATQPPTAPAKVTPLTFARALLRRRR